MSSSNDDGYFAAIKSAFKQDFLLSRSPQLRPQFFVLSLEVVGFGMIIPVLNFFMMKELGMRAWEVGATLSSFGVTQMLGAAFFGRCSDSWGRRGIMIFAFLWAGTWQIAIYMVRNFYEMLFVRAMGGMSGGTAAVSIAYILDVVDPWDRGQYLGLFGAATSVGFAIGPGVGAGLVAFDVMSRRAMFVLAGSIAIVSGILTFFFVKESLPQDRRRALCGSNEKADAEKAGDWQAFNLGLGLLWIAQCASAAGVYFLYSMYSFLVDDLFGFGDSEFGLILMCVGLWGIVVAAFLFPAAIRLFGPYATTICGAIITGISLISLPYMTNLYLHCICMALFGLGSGIFEPGVLVLYASYASMSHLGFANGWGAFFSRLGSIGSPILAGVLYESSGSSAFIVGGSFCILAGVFVFMTYWLASTVTKDKESAPLVAGKSAGKGSG